MSDGKILAVKTRTGFYVLSAILNTLAIAFLITKIKFSRRYSPYSLTLLSLAFADSVLGWYGSWYNIYKLFHENGYPYGGVGFRTGHIASILNILLITFERYISIYLPFFYDQWLSKRKLSIVIIVIWSLTACICATDLILESNGFASNTIYPFVLAAEVYPSVIVLLVAYVLMYKKIRHRSKVRDATELSKLKTERSSTSLVSSSVRSSLPQPEKMEKASDEKKKVNFLATVSIDVNTAELDMKSKTTPPSVPVSDKTSMANSKKPPKKNIEGVRILHVGVAITASFAVTFLPYATMFVIFKRNSDEHRAYFDVAYLLAPWNSIINGFTVLIYNYKNLLQCCKAKEEKEVTVVTT